MSPDEIAECVPALSFDELRELSSFQAQMIPEIPTNGNLRDFPLSYGIS